MPDITIADKFPHRPVLYQEVLDIIRPFRGGLYIDCTIGSGGHSYGILKASSPDGKILAFDLDPIAVRTAKENLESYKDRILIIRDHYRNIREHLDRYGWKSVNGTILDLGVSSMQFDLVNKGFSFRSDAPLDMRFDLDNPLTAEEIINTFSRNSLIKIFREFGEISSSGKLTDLIIRNRPINSTLALADLIRNYYQPRSRRSKQQKIHPATQVFQALRITVNNELEAIKEVLPIIMGVLNDGGRLVVISYHSLEDRIVKNFFRRESKDCICPVELLICQCDHKAELKILTKKPITPTEVEIKVNPRSRSAKLRAVEKLA